MAATNHLPFLSLLISHLAPALIHLLNSSPSHNSLFVGLLFLSFLYFLLPPTTLTAVISPTPFQCSPALQPKSWSSKKSSCHRKNCDLQLIKTRHCTVTTIKIAIIFTSVDLTSSREVAWISSASQQLVQSSCNSSSADYSEAIKHASLLCTLWPIGLCKSEDPVIQVLVAPINWAQAATNWRP